MTLLERIDKLERDVKLLRIIDSEDIFAEETHDGVQLHLEDPFIDEENDDYIGMFKVVQTKKNKIKIVDGLADNYTEATIAGDALINGTEFTDIAAKELTIVDNSWIYLISTAGESVPNAPVMQVFTERQEYELGKSKTLISRVKFADGKISKFSQEVHGPITGYIDGDCES